MKTIFDAAYVLAIRTLFGGHAPSILISLWGGVSIGANIRAVGEGFFTV